MRRKKIIFELNIEFIYVTLMYLNYGEKVLIHYKYIIL
jgi:hypothetical protein